MIKRATFLVLGLALTASVLAAPRADNAVASDVIKLASGDGIKDWAAASKAGEGLAKKHDIADVMGLMKLRRGDKGGLGLGEKPGTIAPDGIEAQIINMSKKPNMAQIKKFEKEFVKSLEITATIAAISTHQVPAKIASKPADVKQWKDWMQEMHKSSLELIKELKGGNPANIKTAANKLNATCTDCHGKYRD